MSCLPQTPTGKVIASTPANAGWVAFNTIPTTALAQYFGLSVDILAFPSMAEGQNQHIDGNASMSTLSPKY